LKDGLVEARVGVDVRAETHAGRLQKCHDVIFRKVTRAVEAHVLDEMRETALVVLFENGSRVDDEPELGSPQRLLVRAQVVAKPVGQRANRNSGIHRYGGCERHVLRTSANSPLRTRDQSRQCGDRQG